MSDVDVEEIKEKLKIQKLESEEEIANAKREMEDKIKALENEIHNEIKKNAKQNENSVSYEKMTEKLHEQKKKVETKYKEQLRELSMKYDQAENRTKEMSHQLTLSKSARNNIAEEFQTIQKEVSTLKEEKQKFIKEKEEMEKEYIRLKSNKNNENEMELLIRKYEKKIKEKEGIIQRYMENEVVFNEKLKKYELKLIENKDYYEKKLKKLQNDKKNETNIEIQELEEIIAEKELKIQEFEEIEKEYKEEIVNLQKSTQNAFQKLNSSSTEIQNFQSQMDQLVGHYSKEIKKEKENSSNLLKQLNQMKEEFDKNEETIQSFKITLHHANEEIKILEAAQREFENVNKQKFKQLRSELFEKQKQNMMLISQLDKISTKDVKEFEKSVDQQLKQFSDSSEVILDDYQKRSFEYEKTINKLKNDLTTASKEIQILDAAQLEFQKVNKKTVKHVKNELNQNLQEKRVFERYTEKGFEKMNQLKIDLENSEKEIKILDSAQLEFQTVTKMQFKKLKAEIMELKNQNQILNSIQQSSSKDNKEITSLLKENKELRSENETLIKNLKSQTKKNANDYYTQFADNLAQDKQKLSDELKIEKLSNEKLKFEFDTLKQKASAKIKNYELEIERLKSNGNTKNELKELKTQKQMFQLLALVLPVIAAMTVYFMK
eukprot:gene263-6678_t